MQTSRRLCHVLKWERRAPASPAQGPWTPAADKREGRGANDESGNNRETLGKPLSGPPAGSLLAGRRGSCGRRKKGGGSRGIRQSKDIERDWKGGREWHRSLCSLNEVFFLFFCVSVVALGVDDGCVCVRRVVCPFSLVCQVRSWGSGERKRKKNKTTNTQRTRLNRWKNKRRAAQHGF